MKHFALKAIEVAELTQQYIDNEEMVIEPFTPISYFISKIPRFVSEMVRGKTVKIDHIKAYNTYSNNYAMYLHCKWLGMSVENLAKIESYCGSPVNQVGEPLAVGIKHILVKPVENSKYEVTVRISGSDYSITEVVPPIPVVSIHTDNIACYIDATICNPYMTAMSVILAAMSMKEVWVCTRGVLPMTTEFMKELVLERLVVSTFAVACEFVPSSTRTDGTVLFKSSVNNYDAYKKIGTLIKDRTSVTLDFSDKSAAHLLENKYGSQPILTIVGNVSTVSTSYKKIFI